MDLDLVANLYVITEGCGVAQALVSQTRDQRADLLLVLRLVRYGYLEFGRFISVMHTDNQRGHRVAALALQRGDIQPIWIAQHEVHL